MSMLDAFFNKGFKAAKCKTLLKLTIPRIKLLRNRREIQIRQMRRDIAKLLETGQEATARIRVEHIIREENMMAAQEVLELFCELISVRLPIIETQRECPLDLKEAISSVCFAAPRCADLPELQQVQMLFVSKYGREFVAAATELMPDCGVNRQLIELLSVRAPSAETKLKLLKEIAEEHEIDWDPAASETELFKPHEDLLDGPTQFVSGSKVPLPKEKYDETLYSPAQAHHEEPDSEADFDPLEFPEVPNVSLRPSATVASAPEIVHPPPSALNPGIDRECEPSQHLGANEIPSQKPYVEHEQVMQEISVANKDETVSAPAMGNKQFLPFATAPSLSSVSFSASQKSPPPTLPRVKSDVVNVDLQDVLAAAQAAAESAERAAAAARSAASLAQLRIAELTKRKDDQVPDNNCENPFSADNPNQPATMEKPYVSHQHSMDSSDGDLHSPGLNQDCELKPGSEGFNHPSHESVEVAFDSSAAGDHIFGHEQEVIYQPQRLPSMDDDTYFSHPNLFTSENSNPGSGAHSFPDISRSDHAFEHENAHHQPQRLPSMDDDFSYPNLFTSNDSNHGSGAHSFSGNSRSTHDL